MKMSRQCFVAFICVLGLSYGLRAQQPRPPAVPLITNEPSFSVWSMSDHLTDGPTKHWSEALQPMTGLARIDGQTSRWRGGAARGFRLPATQAMQHEAVELTPLHTRYRFTAAGIELRVTFF